jgi:hypothetical protein
MAAEIQEHQARCQPHLVRLRMLATGEAGLILTRRTIVDIAQATNAILAEAEAAGRHAQAADPGRPGRNSTGWNSTAGHPAAATFLRVRLNRLSAAAKDVVAAALAANSAEMRCQLRRFDALTTAIWTVMQAVYGPVQRDQARRPLSRRLPGSSLDPTAGAALGTLVPRAW